MRQRTQIVATPWDELLRRFGAASQDVAEFRSAFEAALRLVFAAERLVDLAVDDDGVSIRRAEPAEDEIAADGMTPMQLGANVTEVDAEKQSEPPAILPSTIPIVAAE